MLGCLKIRFFPHFDNQRFFCDCVSTILNSERKNPQSGIATEMYLNLNELFMRWGNREEMPESDTVLGL